MMQTLIGRSQERGAGITFNKHLTVFPGRYSLVNFELPVEIGNIIKPAGITYVCNVTFFSYQ